MYKHPEEKLFLPVYVDDFKLAGRAENLSRMWKKLGALLGLENPIPFHENVYLCCGQQNVQVPERMLSDKQALYKTLHANVVHGNCMGKPDAQELDPPISAGQTERG